MPNRLADQAAIVTGGNSGIGEGAARLFAQEGAKVALLARREEEGRSVERSIREGGGEALFVRCDVSDREQVDAAVQRVADEYGRIDILFNNAGGGDRGNFPNEEDDGWDRVLSREPHRNFLYVQGGVAAHDSGRRGKDSQYVVGGRRQGFQQEDVRPGWQVPVRFLLRGKGGS